MSTEMNQVAEEVTEEVTTEVRAIDMGNAVEVAEEADEGHPAPDETDSTVDSGEEVGDDSDEAMEAATLSDTEVEATGEEEGHGDVMAGGEDQEVAKDAGREISSDD